ncbi:hypothetical protein AHF37_06227 [Paragonimus kellicotti]|nr:hypothetical protein AHF37_06227 [Paragonimus kellicotti]
MGSERLSRMFSITFQLYPMLVVLCYLSYYALQNFRQLTSAAERYRFCEEYFIRDHVVSEIIRLMGDYARLLHEHRYIATPSPTDPGANINMSNFPLFRAILCGALFPNILKLVPQIKDGRVCRPKVHARPSEGDISINPKSVNVVNLVANELVPTVQTQRYPWEPKAHERPSGEDGVQSSQSKPTALPLDNQKQDV